MMSWEVVSRRYRVGPPGSVSKVVPELRPEDVVRVAACVPRRADHLRIEECGLIQNGVPTPSPARSTDRFRNDASSDVICHSCLPDRPAISVSSCSRNRLLSVIQFHLRSSVHVPRPAAHPDPGKGTSIGLSCRLSGCALNTRLPFRENGTIGLHGIWIRYRRR